MRTAIVNVAPNRKARRWPARGAERECIVMLIQYCRALAWMLLSPLCCGAAWGQPIMLRSLTYADLADLSLSAQIVAKIHVTEVIDLPARPEVQPANGVVRRYIEGQISVLIKGPQDMPSALKFVAQMPVDARGKAEKIKKTDQIIFARSVPRQPDTVQIIAPDAMIDWTSGEESTAHSIIAESLRRGAPPHIRGVDSIFSAPGDIPGQRESQFFLKTDSQPVSITFFRKPDTPPSWTVALGELTDAGLPPPHHDTLLWYELACQLPDALPSALLEAQDATSSDALKDDYKVIRTDLGPCDRTRH